MHIVFNQNSNKIHEFIITSNKGVLKFIYVLEMQVGEPSFALLEDKLLLINLIDKLLGNILE
jgi:hypothetical protein